METGAETRRVMELVGFAAHRLATELREVRERLPLPPGGIGDRIRALEEDARTLAGQAAMELRQLDEARRFQAH